MPLPRWLFYPWPAYLLTCVCLCDRQGLPLHPDKLEGPATCWSILGIELDSDRLQACLPSEKRLDCCIAWRVIHFCKRQNLEFTIGHLYHICKVAPQGRTFLDRMIGLLCAFRLDDHPIRLNQEFRRDLTWWQEPFQTRDGLSFFCMPMWAPVLDFEVSLDAVGPLGYGAIFNTQWFCCAWAMEQRSLLIRYNELF